MLAPLGLHKLSLLHSNWPHNNSTPLQPLPRAEPSPSSEIIISSIDHEANISPWVRLAALGNHTIKWWTPSKDSLRLTAENLRPLLSEKTALVACTHTSNVVGGIHNIRAITDEVHKIKGARLCVDGVALAPHRAVDVKALGCDFYSFSWYKVSPHFPP